MRERTKVIQIRLTEKEKADILRKAKKCKMSASAYLRQLAKGHSPKEYPSQLRSLCWELELMAEEFKGKNDEKYRNYLLSSLKEIREFLYWKDGEQDGDNKDMDD